MDFGFLGNPSAGTGIWNNPVSHWSAGVGRSLSNAVNSAQQGFDNLYNNIGSGKEATDYQKQVNLELMEYQNAFNSAEAAKARDWEQMMSSTAIQRQVEDLKEAGLNPWLALQSGINGASTGSGQAASGSASSVSRPDDQRFKAYISTMQSAIKAFTTLGSVGISNISAILSILPKMASSAAGLL